MAMRGHAPACASRGHQQQHGANRLPWCSSAVAMGVPRPPGYPLNNPQAILVCRVSSVVETRAKHHRTCLVPPGEATGSAQLLYPLRKHGRGPKRPRQNSGAMPTPRLDKAVLACGTHDGKHT